MKILLMDLDLNNRRRAFPNLALMKLSAYHKARDDEVFLNFPLCQPEISYASCVFTWNAKQDNRLSADTIIGGSGITLKRKLPSEIEHIMPDYSLYPAVSFSLGFTSRGCIRKCPFCLVPEKEGGIHPHASIYEFWDKSHKKIILLDNNLLASPNWKQTMNDLIAEGLEADFNQGLDIRLVNEENIAYLKRVKTKQLRFAFDCMSYETSVRKGIELLLKNGLSPRKISFYVLVGFDEDETAIARMEILKTYNVDIYPMIYKAEDGKEPKLKPASFSLEGYHGSWHNLRKVQRVVSRQHSWGNEVVSNI